MFATTYSQHVIMSVQMDEFSAWLLREMESRGWNQAEMHRRSGLSRTIISDVLQGKVSPGFEFCIAIGKALHLPAEQIMRLAGLLPLVPAKTEQHEKLLYMFNQLPQNEKERLLNHIEATLMILERERLVKRG